MQLFDLQKAVCYSQKCNTNQIYQKYFQYKKNVQKNRQNKTIQNSIQSKTNLQKALRNAQVVQNSNIYV